MGVQKRWRRHEYASAYKRAVIYLYDSAQLAGGSDSVSDVVTAILLFF